MARAATVRIHGLKEVNRAFRRLGTGIDKEIKAELKKLAEPVAAESRSNIGQYPGASTSTIKTYATQKGAGVRQSAGKRGGQHANFGGLQMIHMIGIISEHEDEIVEGVEDLLDRLTREEGF